ncbi:PAAR domain-containing protein [Burkholderia ubonensis]|uniref:PAAR domain-containing protein n=1 Tax=Burkholderia ubonensis TaxID=101571 RepID=UPI0009B313F1|nr:PAAR domain-containing protein [Burkholderia ubonensis]
MGKAAVRNGDRTTTGGSVFAHSSTMYDNNKLIALDGEFATCGECKGSWRIYGTGRDVIEGSRSVVVSGDLVLCPCKKNRVIAGADAGVLLESGSSAAKSQAGGSTQSTAFASNPIDGMNQHFRVINSDGTPVVGLPYRLETSDGRMIIGTTTADGFSQLVSASDAQRVRLVLRISNS